MAPPTRELFLHLCGCMDTEPFSKTYSPWAEVDTDCGEGELEKLESAKYACETFGRVHNYWSKNMLKAIVPLVHRQFNMEARWKYWAWGWWVRPDNRGRLDCLISSRWKLSGLCCQPTVIEGVKDASLSQTIHSCWLAYHRKINCWLTEVPLAGDDGWSHSQSTQTFSHRVPLPEHHDSRWQELHSDVEWSALLYYDLQPSVS